MSLINWAKENWAEAWTCEMLRKHCGFKKVEMVDAGSACDAIATRTETIEIKTDYKAQNSGNLFIEYHNSHRKLASGIMSSTSTYYAIHAVHVGLFLYRTEFLRAAINRFIETKPEWVRYSVGDKNSNGVLLPISHVERFHISQQLCQFIEFTHEEVNQFFNGLQTCELKNKQQLLI